MLNINELIGFGICGRQRSESRFTGISLNTASAITWNHNDVAIGDPDGSRLIVVNTGAYSVSPAITGVTCNGVAMTKAVNRISGSALTDTAIFYLRVPAGDTADFVVTKAGSNSNGNHLAVYALYGVENDVPYITSDSVANPFVLSANVLQDTFGVAVAQTYGGTGTFSEVGLVEDWEGSAWMTSKNDVSCSQYFNAAESPRTMTITCSYVNHHSACFAAWK